VVSTHQTVANSLTSSDESGKVTKHVSRNVESHLVCWVLTAHGHTEGHMAPKKKQLQ